MVAAGTGAQLLGQIGLSPRRSVPQGDGSLVRGHLGPRLLISDAAGSVTGVEVRTECVLCGWWPCPGSQWGGAPNQRQSCQECSSRVSTGAS